jgi:hypothetical protein
VEGRGVGQPILGERIESQVIDGAMGCPAKVEYTDLRIGCLLKNTKIPALAAVVVE